jgi:hypothetical protein
MHDDERLITTAHRSLLSSAMRCTGACQAGLHSLQQTIIRHAKGTQGIRYMFALQTCTCFTSPGPTLTARQEQNYMYTGCYKAQQQRSHSADAWSLRCSLGTASNHWVKPPAQHAHPSLKTPPLNHQTLTHRLLLRSRKLLAEVNLAGTAWGSSHLDCLQQRHKRCSAVTGRTPVTTVNKEQRHFRN